MPIPIRQFKLQRLLVAALLLVLLPVVAIHAWFSYRTAQNSSVKFQEQLASGVSAHVFDKVLQFFEIPSRVVRYNVEQFRIGMLDISNPQKTQRSFLLQLGQQPALTFLSIGTANGEYFAASRPPLGEDKTLRLLQATETEKSVMSLYRVNADNQRGPFISYGNTFFDARTRPWFKEAVGNNSARWYPTYRYAIADSGGAYDAMGIGMSAPLYNETGDFLGVTTADVALVQLNTLLESITKELGGTAFLFDEGGDLLAASTLEDIYKLKEGKTVRVKAIESPNSLISTASKVIHEASESRGRTVRVVNGESYLLDWWQYPLPDGPTITIANMLPQSRFDAPSRGLLFNVLLFSSAIFLVSLIVTVFVSQWVSKPLVALGEWASKMGNGERKEANHRASPIVEVESLSTALQLMADSVKFHADHLEQEVATRTAELELANIQLEKLSNTDGLTGVANRRYFDQIFLQEVARTRRLKEPIALIMLDVDQFKGYNDHYGHLAGDDCLLQIANILKNTTRRPSDLAARYGGEEFVIITAHCDAEDAMTLAEVLRQKLEELGIAHALSSAGVVTASFGVAVFVPDELNGATQLIQMADKALYRAKEGGRNRVELALLETSSH